MKLWCGICILYSEKQVFSFEFGYVPDILILLIHNGRVIRGPLELYPWLWRMLLVSFKRYFIWADILSLLLYILLPQRLLSLMFITSQTPSREFLLRVSYLEIYNEVWASFHPLKLFIWWCTSTTVHFMLLMYVLMCKFVCMHYNFVVLPSEFCVWQLCMRLFICPLIDDGWWIIVHKENVFQAFGPVKIHCFTWDIPVSWLSYPFF